MPVPAAVTVRFAARGLLAALGRVVDVLAGEPGRAVRVGRRRGRGAALAEGVQLAADRADVELPVGHRDGAVDGGGQHVGVQQLAVGGVDHLERRALDQADHAVDVGGRAEDRLVGLPAPLHRCRCRGRTR